MKTIRFSAMAFSVDGMCLEIWRGRLICKVCREKEHDQDQIESGRSLCQ